MDTRTLTKRFLYVYFAYSARRAELASDPQYNKNLVNWMLRNRPSGLTAIQLPTGSHAKSIRTIMERFAAQNPRFDWGGKNAFLARMLRDNAYTVPKYARTGNGGGYNTRGYRRNGNPVPRTNTPAEDNSARIAALEADRKRDRRTMSDRLDRIYALQSDLDKVHSALRAEKAAKVDLDAMLDALDTVEKCREVSAKVSERIAKIRNAMPGFKTRAEALELD